MNLLLAAFASVVTSFCCSGVGGGYCGRTASGVPVHAGSVAADWRVLSPGTRLSIPAYGVGIVEDTGSAIVGTRLDVWFWSCDDARQWGRRWVRVTVLPAVAPAPPADDAETADVPADDATDQADQEAQ